MSTGDGDTCLALWKKKVSEVHKGDGDRDDIQVEELIEWPVLAIGDTEVKRSRGWASILYEPHPRVINVGLWSGEQVYADGAPLPKAIIRITDDHIPDLFWRTI